MGKSNFTRLSQSFHPDFISSSIFKMPTKVYKCKVTDQEVFTQYATHELIDDTYYKITGEMTIDEKREYNTGQNKSEEAPEDDDEEAASYPESSLAKACRLVNVSADYLIPGNSSKKNQLLFANQLKLHIEKLAEISGEDKDAFKAKILDSKMKEAIKTVVGANIKKAEFMYYATEGDEYDREGINIPTLEYGENEEDKVEMFVWKWAVYEDKY